MKRVIGYRALKSLLWLLALVPLFVFAFADNFRFQKISPENGLSQQTVLAIYQDSKGYMWFGTQEGLNKYDGVTFTTYMPIFNDKTSISSAWVESISEDANGNIWVGTNNGVNVLDPETNTFTRYHSNNANSINDDGILFIHRANNGAMWLATRKGLNRYDPINGSFRHHNFIDDEESKSTSINALSEDITGALWLGTNRQGLMRFDPSTEQISLAVKEFFVNDKKLRVSIVDLFLDEEQVLWIATFRQGVFKLDLKLPKTDAIENSIKKVEEVDSNSVTEIYADATGTLWLGTSRGIYYKKKDSSTFSKYFSQSSESEGLAETAVYQFYSDTSGVFWVGTFNGLYKWNTRTTQFEYYHANDTASKALSSNAISVLEEDEFKNIYVASVGGVDVVDLESQTVNPLPMQTESSPGLLDTRVMSMEFVDSEDLWLGYMANGLSRYNPKNNTYKHYAASREDPTSLPSNAISAIVTTPSNEVWVGTYGGGLARYNKETDDFTNYRHDSTDVSSLSSDKILSIYASSDGNLWIGTWNEGINVFVPSSGTAFRIANKENDPRSLASNKITAVHEDSERNIWIGTHGGGLNILTAENRDRGNIEFQKIDTQSGMPSNVVYGITEDNNGFLWLSTNKGLVKLHKESKQITIYRYSQGIQGDEFHSGAYFKDSNGYMYFGGIGGLTRFHPEKIKANLNPPKVDFTHFQRLDKFYDIATVKNEDGAVEIFHKDYLVSFEFAALDFVAPKNNQYMYKLEGFDKDWIRARGTQRATYTNLPSGTFTLRVRASNNDGVWNEQGASLEVVVHPAPWFSWWAYGIYSILALIVSWYAYVLYRRKAETSEHFRLQLLEQVDIRTAELKEANEQLRQASITDQLTGLFNRRYLAEVITELTEDISRRFGQAIIDNDMDAESGPRLMALMFDLDGFKAINDNFGHEAGDQVIMQVASILQTECRDKDIVIRWGGDEYMVVAEVTDVAEAVSLAERIRVSISQHSFEVGLPNKFNLSSSLGFALYPFNHFSPHSVTWDQVNLLADHALYKSKEAGRNTWSGIVQSDKELPFSILNSLVPNLDRALDRQDVNMIQRNSEHLQQVSGID